MNEFTEYHVGKAPHDRLTGVWTFTTPAGGRGANRGITLEDSTKALQIGFRSRHQPPKYSIGVLVVSESQSAGVEAADGLVITGNSLSWSRGVMVWRLNGKSESYTRVASTAALLRLSSSWTRRWA